MMRIRRPPPGVVLVAIGLLGASLAVLDPELRAGRLLGPLLALAGLARESSRRRDRTARLLLPASVALALGVAASTEPQLHRADFPTYFAFLRSLYFDHDLDFANEWAHWRFKEQPITPTGHRFTQGSIGPAVFWAPFFVLGDLLARVERALGAPRYDLDGFSAPYVRSAVVGTVVLVVLGLHALRRVVDRHFPGPVSLLAVLATFGATSLVFYAFVQPGMAHGLSFALAAFAVLLADRLSQGGGTRDWLLLGLVLGLLVAVRLQAAVLVVFLLPLLLREARQRTLPARGLAAAALGAFLGFLPQMLAWKVIYGRFITLSGDLEAWSREAGVNLPVLFRPAAWFDPRSLHFADVLFSAERGFFTWTPLCLVGILGLLLALRRAPLLAAGGLLAFLATAWWSGSLAGFEGGDSFGARRFDLVLPFVALGLAAVLEAARRRPLLAPGLLVAGFVAWNVGFIRLWRQNEFPTRAAPLPRLAALQARQAEALFGDLLEPLFGARGRAFAYNTFEAEYQYWNLPEDGRLELGNPHLRYLAGGWSEAVNRTGPPQYRTALFPRACLQFPLMVAAPLEATVTLKAPGRLGEPQALALELNGSLRPAQAVPAEWSDVAFDLPQASARPGRNTLCLVFSASARKRGEGQETAAHVRRVVVRSKASYWPNPLWGLRGLGR